MMNEDYKNLMDEAIRDIEVAENHFNYAEPDYVDVAILELSTAMKKLEIVVNRTKEANAN